MRGKAVVFLVLLGATWTTARIFINRSEDPAVRERGQPQIASRAVTPIRTAWLELMDKQQPNLAKMPMFAQSAGTGLPRPAPTKFHDAARPQPRPALEAHEQTEESFIHIAIADFKRPAEALSLGPAPPAKISPRPIAFYAYRFWRSGQSTQGSLGLGLGQYGGSQSAVLIAVPLDRFSGADGVSRFALIARVSASHGRLRERELAAGLKWRPLVSFPAQISVERRFREDRPDAIAAFVSGGTDGTKLPLGFVLDGYGQAGFVGGKGGGGFADIQVQAQRPLISDKPVKIDAGVGLWGGGQDSMMRVEIGPSIRVILPAGGAQFRLDASWRFQIAGNLRPSNGPAVTLSTSF